MTGEAPPSSKTILETPRLRIRTFTLDDAPFAYELVNDPAWIQNIGDRNVHSLDDARGYLERGPIAMYEKHGFSLFAVVLKETGATIGMCGLIRREVLEDVDIGFAFLPAYRRKGYALESAEAVMEHAWGPLKLARVVAIVDPANTPSIRLLETLGFIFERTMKLPNDPVELRLLGREAPKQPD
jgi:RimJ/RimL family protein N-acetyltransferase